MSVVSTFLRVHRLSLQQLNRYFNQPVINNHILMAQRLADACGENSVQERAYERIIESSYPKSDFRSCSQQFTC